jgi:hypothetical protein
MGHQGQNLAVLLQLTAWLPITILVVQQQNLESPATEFTHEIFIFQYPAGILSKIFRVPGLIIVVFDDRSRVVEVYFCD